MLLNVINYLDGTTYTLVHSYAFIIGSYAIALGGGLFARRLLNLHIVLVLLMIVVVPFSYIELAQHRYFGGENLQYDTGFTIVMWAMMVNGVLWLLSMKPLSLMFQIWCNRKRINELRNLTFKRVISAGERVQNRSDRDKVDVKQLMDNKLEK